MSKHDENMDEMNDIESVLREILKRLIHIDYLLDELNSKTPGYRFCTDLPMESSAYPRRIFPPKVKDDEA